MAAFGGSNLARAADKALEGMSGEGGNQINHRRNRKAMTIPRTGHKMALTVGPLDSVQHVPACAAHQDYRID